MFCTLNRVDQLFGLSMLTPLCLALPQLCLPGDLRLLWGNCRKLTAWIQKAITCLVLHRMFSNLGNMKNWMVISTVLILSFLGWYYLINQVVLFEHLFWSHVDMTHHMLSHFCSGTQFICWKIITRIIIFFVRPWFLSAAAVIIVKANNSQTSKNISSFSSRVLSNFTPKQPKQRQHDHMRFKKQWIQWKPVYVSKGKVTKR